LPVVQRFCAIRLRIFLRTPPGSVANKNEATTVLVMGESVVKNHRMLEKLILWVKALIERECPLVSNDHYDAWGN
jgi:hypothetical protein